MSGNWISTQDRLPIESLHEGEMFRSVHVIVTNGKNVCAQWFQAGTTATGSRMADRLGAGGFGGFWSTFDTYGELLPSSITHWMPMPTTPKDTPNERG